MKHNYMNHELYSTLDWEAIREIAWSHYKIYRDMLFSGPDGQNRTATVITGSLNTIASMYASNYCDTVMGQEITGNVISTGQYSRLVAGTGATKQQEILINMLTDRGMEGDYFEVPRD